VPKRGEKAELGRYRFIVIRTDGRRIELLKLVLMPEESASSS
jgi:magnesium and cobalt transporter